MPEPIAFAGSPLDRVSAKRRDPAWIERLLREDSTRFLPLSGLRVPLYDEGEPGLVWLGSAAREVVPDPSRCILLGLDGDAAAFALDVSGVDDPGAALGLAGVARFHELRAVAGRLPGAEAGIAAQARALVDWHARHRYCAACGAETEPEGGGASRACRACGAQHFPRTDPVAIVVVTRGDRCLLGRSARFPEGMYSAIAGFVDQGETIEEAVRREVMEETGIEVGAVHYTGSQPWPFPSSLMIGCLADGLSDTIEMDPVEMSDVRWFERESIRAAIDGQPADFSLPQPLALAHHLIRAWLDGGRYRPAR